MIEGQNLWYVGKPTTFFGSRYLTLPSFSAPAKCFTSACVRILLDGMSVPGFTYMDALVMLETAKRNGGRSLRLARVWKAYPWA
jgi:hypothetical protein